MATITSRQAPRRTRLWVTGLAVTTLVLLLGGAVVLSLIPSDEELALRASSELEAALGVPVRVGSLHWKLRPLAVVEVEDVVIQTRPPIEIHHLLAHPNVSALWQRRLKLTRVEVDGATLPQLALRGLHVSPAKKPEKSPEADKVSDADARPAARFHLDELPLDQLVFRQVSWISRYGSRVVYDGNVHFDLAWRPRQAELSRPGFEPQTHLTLTRQASDDRWSLRSAVGGGTANGELKLQTRANGQLQLGGKLQLRRIEAVSALGAFNRRSIIAGKIDGETTVAAQGSSIAELARTLHTRTPFVMGPSTLLRFDLSRAIHTLGKEHAGKTPLDSVTGQLDTQNTRDGMVLNFTGVKATSGALTASGEGRIAQKKIEAELAVDLVEGLVGVPLKLSGPLAHVKVSVPASAVVGAVVGTAVLPIAGTAIGVRIGAAVGKIFGTGTGTGTGTGKDNGNGNGNDNGNRTGTLGP